MRNLQRIFKLIVKFHDGGLISTTITVVGRGEDGDNIPIVTPIVSLHNQLMSSRNERYTIRMVKSLRNVLAKRVASSPR